MRFDERERPSFVKEIEVSSLSPFMRTGGRPGLRLHEIFLWSVISLEAWSFGLNEKEERRKVSSANEGMLEDVDSTP